MVLVLRCAKQSLTGFWRMNAGWRLRMQSRTRIQQTVSGLTRLVFASADTCAIGVTAIARIEINDDDMQESKTEAASKWKD